MIRAAAKNHAHVSVCVDPQDYDLLLAGLGGSTESPDAHSVRRRLAWKAYQHCASYDSTVAEWLWEQIGEPPPRKRSVMLPAVPAPIGYQHFTSRFPALSCSTLLYHPAC